MYTQMPAGSTVFFGIPPWLPRGALLFFNLLLFNNIAHYYGRQAAIDLAVRKHRITNEENYLVAEVRTHNSADEQRGAAGPAGRDVDRSVRDCVIGVVVE
jgi:hypothetical protein